MLYGLYHGTSNPPQKLVAVSSDRNKLWNHAQDWLHVFANYNHELREPYDFDGYGDYVHIREVPEDGSVQSNWR